jgi:hypothetical protein
LASDTEKELVKEVRGGMVCMYPVVEGAGVVTIEEGELGD